MHRRNIVSIEKGTLQIVLAVLKVLEANYMAATDRAVIPRPYGDRISTKVVRANEAARIITKLSSTEKEAFRTVLLSMILMTAGNVATVRNPEIYDAGGAEPISKLMNEYTKELWRISGGSDPSSYKPTKKDYATAKKILPIVSSIPASREKFLKIIRDKDLLGDPTRTAKEEDIKVADVLYRGLRGMSNQALMYLFFADKPKWDMTRAVSTSEDRDTSLNFAKGSSVDGPDKKDGWRILFTIKNDDGRGFDAGNLSFYGVEDEYVLSGNLTVDAVGFQMMAIDDVTNESQYINIYRSAGSDLIIKFLGREFRGKDASNIFLSIMQDKPAANNVYDEDGKIKGRKISIFRIGKRKYRYDKLTIVYVNATVQTN